MFFHFNHPCESPSDTGMVVRSTINKKFPATKMLNVFILLTFRKRRKTFCERRVFNKNPVKELGMLAIIDMRHGTCGTDPSRRKETSKID